MRDSHACNDSNQASLAGRRSTNVGSQTPPTSQHSHPKPIEQVSPIIANHPDANTNHPIGRLVLDHITNFNVPVAIPCKNEMYLSSYDKLLQNISSPN
jgi:hypothetical protein